MDTPPAATPDLTVSKDPVDQRLFAWRERLVDLTKRNPLLGLNRARTTKMQVTSPASDAVFQTLVIDGKSLKMPFARKVPASPTRKVQPGPGTTVASGPANAVTATGSTSAAELAPSPPADSGVSPTGPQALFAAAIATGPTGGDESSGAPAPEGGAIASSYELEEEPPATWTVTPGDVTLDVEDSQLFAKQF